MQILSADEINKAYERWKKVYQPPEDKKPGMCPCGSTSWVQEDHSITLKITTFTKYRKGQRARLGLSMARMVKRY